MQLRMKEHPLTAEQIDSLLDAVQVGHLATLGENGFPYVTPVHFVRMNGRIYFHGLAAGLKLKNLRADSRVCFEVEGQHSFIQADIPCDTNTAYQSVIITGNATVVEDRDVKIAALDAGALAGGAQVTETVFARPGMGKLLYDAVMGNDTNLALVALLFVALVTMLATLAADIGQRLLDPRLREA